MTNSTSFTDAKLPDAIGAINQGLDIRNASSSNYVLLWVRTNYQFHAEPSKEIEPSKSLAKFIASASNFKLHMRTFLSAMYGTAREEVYFDQLRRKVTIPGHVSYGRDYYGCYATTTNIGTVRPILTLTYFKPLTRAKLSKLAEVSYHNQTYTVGDIESNDEISDDQVANLSSLEVSNRRVFSLLSVLFADVAIDPQKLPVQQLIQVH